MSDRERINAAIALLDRWERIFDDIPRGSAIRSLTTDLRHALTGDDDQS